MKTLIVASIMAGLLAQSARAAISYSIAGSSYSENFDSLPNTPQNTSLGASPAGWIDDTTTPGASQFSILGWYLHHPSVQAEGGADGHQRVRLGAGSFNTGSFWSYGASSTTERALGALASNTLTPVGGPMYMGLRLRNDTAVTLDSFTLSYNGEQWRDGGATIPVAQSISFAWSTTASAITDANTFFTSVGSLDFTSPVFANTGAGAAVDGNVAGRVNNINATVTGVNWAPGTDLWLRWTDINDANADHGLAIDDVTFSALPVPEPSTYALLGLGALGLALRRRSK